MKLSLALCLCVGLVVLAGCGGSSSDAGPENLVPVTGKVMVNGEAVAGITLTFLPDSGTTGTGGFAATSVDGNFIVKHRSGQEGIEPGTYKVVTSLYLTPTGGPVPEGESAMDHNATESLPPKYTAPNTTPFSAQVAEGMAPLSFEITKRKK